MGIFGDKGGKGDGGQKPPKKPGTGERPSGNPRPATQKPKRGNKPGK